MLSYIFILGTLCAKKIIGSVVRFYCRKQCIVGWNKDVISVLFNSFYNKQYERESTGVGVLLYNYVNMDLDNGINKNQHFLVIVIKKFTTMN